MKVSISLPDDDVDFLDRYAEHHGLASRSAAIHKAVRMLRASGLSAAYEHAWAEWATSGDDQAWEATISDGVS